jgi:uncharacterized phage protein gp47/JayE
MSVKTIDTIQDEYRAYLLGLKPTANADTTDSDWWIRGRTLAGVLNGVYSDIERNAQDAFPQNARREAMLRHLFAYFAESTFKPATVASGPVLVTGTALAGPFSAGLQATHAASGNVYVTTEDVTLDASGNGAVNVQSILAGQTQNLETGAALTIGSAPAGLNAAAVVGTGGISDGTNEEDEDLASVRVLERMRSSARGGNRADYRVWALSIVGVTDASVLRYVNGLGTVGVIITSGTTDIDTALDNGDAIDFTPSTDLIDAVQAYLETVCPDTDCPFVFAPVEVVIPVTCTVKFTTGNKDTILSGQTLSQGELVAREIKRAIYKTGTGGIRKAGESTGYLLKKTIEDMIDSKLSAQDSVVGELLQIVVDRVVTNLDGVNANYELEANERAIPGTVTIVDA